MSEDTFEMTAYCGLRCDRCEMFKATRDGDYAKKEKIAKRWSSEHSVSFKPENIDCKGCKSELLSGWCREICKVRPCAEQKKVTTCAHCSDYQCEKLKEFLLNEPIARANLETLHKTL